MSGICGILRMEGLDDTDRDALRSMLESLRHRGPDASDAHVSSLVALGLTQTKETAAQGGAAPLDDEQCPVRALLDGVIDNAGELRDTLRRKGHTFQTGADTEVLLRAYEAYGADCVWKLRGAYALAVWDNRNRRLLLARDRVGCKPLYYMRAGGRVLFASEIKALLMHPAVERRLDALAMHHLLSFRYVPRQETMFLDVRKLPPAHLLLIGEKDATLKPYWSPRDMKVEKVWVARNDAGRLLDTIKESVLQTARPDESTGVLLSGGLDSSAVTGLLKAGPADVRTFTVGFEHPEGDETLHANLVAEHFRTQHFEHIATDQAMMENIPLMVWHCDEPPASPAVLALHQLCRFAREHVAVALTGDGGDELFGGYERYVADRYLHYYNYIPASVRRNLMLPIFSMASNSTAPGPLQERLEQLASVSPMSDAERHLNWQAPFTHFEKKMLYTHDLAMELRDYNAADIMQRQYDLAEGHGCGFTDQQLLADFIMDLPGGALSVLERAASASGLTVRCPLLSKDVVELALTLPAGMKIKGATTKRILKQTFWNYLPAEVLYRPNQSLAVPLGAWFRGPLRMVARDYLTDNTARSRGLFNPITVERLLREHEDGFRDHGIKLWTLLTLEFWHRIFLDGPAPATPPALL